jgi:hypothetical protein
MLRLFLFPLLAAIARALTAQETSEALGRFADRLEVGFPTPSSSC